MMAIFVKTHFLQAYVLGDGFSGLRLEGKMMLLTGIYLVNAMISVLPAHANMTVPDIALLPHGSDTKGRAIAQGATTAVEFPGIIAGQQAFVQRSTVTLPS